MWAYGCFVADFAEFGNYASTWCVGVFGYFAMFSLASVDLDARRMRFDEARGQGVPASAFAVRDAAVEVVVLRVYGLAYFEDVLRSVRGFAVNGQVVVVAGGL